MKSKTDRIVAGLTLIALAAMVAAYFAPIWWVSLTAPNYPPDAFPDGIRIHFHFDGVYNGCRAAPKGSRQAAEVIEKDLDHTLERWNPVLDPKKQALDMQAEGLDCVHEMNTINHYVGMFPIATGAPVEKPLAKFFFAFFAVMLAGFAIRRHRLRLAVLAVGCAAVAAWMLVDQYALGGLARQVEEYMRETGAFFKEPERIRAWGDNVALATHIVIGFLIAAMVAVAVGVARVRGFELLLVVAPALLPLFFVIVYAGWLWFFGHNLHPWGAFTVKPFMPTVLGEGKVAQFSTYSYPHWGYALLMLVSVCLILALLLRRKQLREENGG